MNYNLKYDAKTLEYPMFKSVPEIKNFKTLIRGQWGTDGNGRIVLIDDNGYVIMILEDIK